MNKTILNHKVQKLSGHLQQNVRTFRGKQAGHIPEFSWQQLVPVVIVLAGIGILIASPKTRNSMAIKLAMLVSSRLMRGEVNGEVNEQV